MRIGFTGTRKGMSPVQKDQLRMVLLALTEANERHEFHHGAAEGADWEADAMTVSLDRNIRRTRHEFDGDGSPLERNLRIVKASDILIAAPDTDKEQLRSGTWATVRYARKARKPVVMLSRG